MHPHKKHLVFLKTSNLAFGVRQLLCQLTLRKLFTIVLRPLDRRVFRWYIVSMKIEVTSPSTQVAEAVRQHLGLSTHTYELWFLADRHHILPKNRDSLNTLLKEAHQMLTDAAAVGGVVGEAEIVHRWGEHGQHDETVWSMSLDEFTKGHRLPMKAI